MVYKTYRYSKATPDQIPGKNRCAACRQRFADVLQYGQH